MSCWDWYWCVCTCGITSVISGDAEAQQKHVKGSFTELNCRRHKLFTVTHHLYTHLTKSLLAAALIFYLSKIEEPRWLHSDCFSLCISIQSSTVYRMFNLQLVGAVVQLVEYRTRNWEVAGSTHTRSAASNLEQVANLLCAQANSASYPRRDRKWVLATATGWRPSMSWLLNMSTNFVKTYSLCNKIICKTFA